MQVIKGFVSITDYINNTPGETSLIGELSTWSTTYSRELGEYQSVLNPGYHLTTFMSLDPITGALEPTLPVTSEQIIELVKACVTYATSHIRPYDSLDFKNTITAAFFDRIESLAFGDWVDNGYLALPEWISWNSIVGDGAVVKIWLSDTAFASQYTDYAVLVIPPIDQLDNFFGFYNTVLNEVAQVTTSDLLDKIALAKGNHPETFLRVLTFDFVNEFNPTERTPVDWGVVIYGQAGDTVDVIKDSIISYILSHSTRDSVAWALIFPDIFKRTEFVLLPRWDKIAIPNLSLTSALYSSIIDPQQSVQLCRAILTFYPDTHIANNVNIIPYDYKGVVIDVVAGPDNVSGKRGLVELYPDYLPVASTTLDFGRMQIETQQWVIFLESLLIIAETATPYSTVPNPFRRIIRNNLLFITGVFNGVNYLVAAKSNSFYA